MRTALISLVAAAFAAPLALAQQCTPAWDYSISNTGIPTGYIGALTVYQGDLIASGSFPSLGVIPGSGYVARYDFDSGSWQSLGAGLNAGPNNAFGTSFTEMNGELYIAGFFQNAGGVSGTRSLARWNGTDFLPVDTGWVLPNAGGPVHAVWSCTSSDFLGSPKVFFGGSFEELNGLPAAHVAMWDGTTATKIVTSMPTLVSSAGSINPLVTAMTVFDDGQGGGKQLYIGGRFNSVDGVPALTVARWNGSTWSLVGTNLGNTIITAEVDCMKVWNDELYIGGTNLRVNGALAQVAKWNGTTWTAVGQNPTGRIWSLETFDDGSVEKLYATGTPISGGINRFFRLEGNTWTVVGGGVDAQGIKLLNYDNKLYVAGSFANAGGQAAGRIAIRTSCLGSGCDPDVNQDGNADQGDVDYLINVVAGGANTTGIDPDFNADGNVDQGDVDSLINVVAGGVCP
ncbi:MAG: hypothetical protein WC718_16145 [Phycisphaerales bacterium]|jgi:hypothetical protein